MQTKRLFCLKVKALFFDDDDRIYWRRTNPLPLFCHVHIDSDLEALIQCSRELLVTHGLSSISKRCHQVRCFFDITQSFHDDVSIDCHITEDEVFFTGFIPPFKRAYFKTSSLPISVLIDSVKQFKRIDHISPRQINQSALIESLEIKNKEQELAWDELRELEELKQQLEKSDSAAIDFTDQTLSQFKEKLIQNIEQKESQAEAQERETELLCKQLLWRYLKILPGDWIHSNVGTYKNNPVQLVVDTVDFDSTHLHIRGTNITQKGEIGKRYESVSIRIKHDEHSK